MRIFALILLIALAALAQAPAGKTQTSKGPASPPAAATAPAAKASPAAAPVAGGQKPVASVMQIMSAMMIPASEALFDAAADPPKDDDAWKKTEYNTLIVAEAANLLMLPGRAKDNGEWMKGARNLRDAAEAAYKAAAARNPDSLTDISNNRIYPICEGCHKTYLKR
jgi:hypothetical protein